jgi:hypothetical protein
MMTVHSRPPQGSSSNLTLPLKPDVKDGRRYTSGRVVAFGDQHAVLAGTYLPASGPVDSGHIFPVGGISLFVGVIHVTNTNGDEEIDDATSVTQHDGQELMDVSHDDAPTIEDCTKEEEATRATLSLIGEDDPVLQEQAYGSDDEASRFFKRAFI